MEPARPDLAPDRATDRESMLDLQRRIAAAATFEDDAAALDRPVDDLVVAGVDQAFLDDRAVSAVVCSVGDAVVERVASTVPLRQPYVPGLLSFREGGPILAAFGSLEREPDLVVFDGNGRLHYREAGLATHMGVVLGLPSVGVAKSMLCGRPAAPIDDLAAGERVAIEADEAVEAPAGTLLGYAVQTRQFEGGSRRINPVYVSPGHRVGPGTAVDLVEALCAGYKLPEPIRRADRYAAAVKAETT